jgi:hypothetical protein
VHLRRYIETFYTTEKLQDVTERLRARKLLAMLLPPVHRACLQLLLDFLCEVAANDIKNKMGIANLAVVFAPSLFFIRGHKGQKMLKEVEIQLHTASTLRGLLENADVLWDVPKEILKQLRQLTEHSKGSRKASNAKDVQKMLKKARGGKSKSAAPMISGELRGGEHLVWVEDPTGKPPVRAKVVVSSEPHHISSRGRTDIFYAKESRASPRHSHWLRRCCCHADPLPVVSMLWQIAWEGGEREVEVLDETIAADVLERVEKGDGGFKLEERDGNIGSRRLHPATRILPVLHANPELRLCVVKA